MQSWLERVWYEGGRGAWLVPLGSLFGALVATRRAAYRRGWLKSAKSRRPLVVVGNLTVGGSGKTPLVVWLVERLRERGIRVGVVSRGYGGTAAGARRVTADSDPALVGDEPVLLARRTGAPVAVARERVAAATLLEAEVDLLIADDGLQHYALARDLEILVIDGERRFGNGRLLPAGPLREPAARAAEADFVLVNGGTATGREIAMRLVPGALVALDTGSRRPLADMQGERVHALAAIGNPARFFATLRAAGLDPIEHPWPDHAALGAADLAFDDALPVLMTEKDAVKCAKFARPGSYWLEVSAELAESDARRLLGAVAATVRPE